MQVFEILPCSEESSCLNSLQRAGLGSGKCGICRLSPGDNAGATVSYWKPDIKGTKHPALVAAKKEVNLKKLQDTRLKRRSVDPAKRRILTQAARAEKQTERQLIHATKNSGRSNKDGDHIAGGEITLDTKLQSKRTNPVILLHELVKVGEDARRAGNWMGALVLRNMNGIGVVAIAEADFARLIQRIQ
jgi:hypothetical protein